MESVFSLLGLTVLERGWLSSNNIVFEARPGATAAVVDTGYDLHSGQTQRLIRQKLGDAPLGRILNTHLHSDHCGGNALLQVAWPGCETMVPSASFDAAATWDPERLSFDATGQTCQRFKADRAVEAGMRIQLGSAAWDVLEAPGHDPEAIMLFEPQSRVLISGDALWESRLAINFPELAGQPGFGEARRALDTIETLCPAVVIPGHGRPFTQVAEALSHSRSRLSQFETDPARHTRSAIRALVMFRMLERRRCELVDLMTWIVDTPVFSRIANTGDNQDLRHSARTEMAERAVHSMVRDGLLARTGEMLWLADK